MNRDQSHIVGECTLSSSVESCLATVHILKLNIWIDETTIWKVDSCFRVTKVKGRAHFQEAGVALGFELLMLWYPGVADSLCLIFIGNDRLGSVYLSKTTHKSGEVL